MVDFGLAQRLYPGHDLKEMMGTPEFVAPEVINYETIGLYTDMWYTFTYTPVIHFWLEISGLNMSSCS